MRLGALNETSKQAAREFTAAFDELEAQPRDPAASQAVEDYYAQTFAADLAEATGETVDGATFVPTGAAQEYLQYHYVIPFEDWEEAILTNGAGDGSAWTAAHEKYHNYFRAMTQLQEFEDVLMIDTDGNVVYTAFKGVDLGTNLLEGPYRLSNLSEAYREAMSRNIVGDVVLTDFAAYNPSLGNPAGWAVTPIADGGEVIGALAIELPIDRINQVMTVGGEWEINGLGRDGRDLPRRQRRHDALDLAPAAGRPRGVRGGGRRGRARADGRRAQRAERQHAAAADRGGGCGHPRARRRERHDARAQLPGPKTASPRSRRSRSTGSTGSSSRRRPRPKRSFRSRTSPATSSCRRRA